MHVDENLSAQEDIFVEKFKYFTFWKYCFEENMKSNLLNIWLSGKRLQLYVSSSMEQNVFYFCPLFHHQVKGIPVCMRMIHC